MKKEVKLLPPMMPNFVGVEMPGGTKDIKIPIVEMSVEEAEQYGELMKQTFIKHHQAKVKAKSTVESTILNNEKNGNI